MLNYRYFFWCPLFIWTQCSNSWIIFDYSDNEKNYVSFSCF